MQRRDFVKLVSGAFVLAFIAPLNAFAAIWNKAAIETSKLNEAEKNLEINDEKPSEEILITLPDKAENGAIKLRSKAISLTLKLFLF